MKRKRKGKLERAKKAATGLPIWAQHAAFTKSTRRDARAHKARQLGTFGAASEVRHIDPATYEAEKNKEL